MIRLLDVSYVRLGTRDLESATRFATEYLGLEVAQRLKDAVYFKSDERAHTLCYFEGAPEDQVAAFEVGSRDDLSSAAERRRKLISVRCGTSSHSRIPPATGSSWSGGRR